MKANQAKHETGERKEEQKKGEEGRGGEGGTFPQKESSDLGMGGWEPALPQGSGPSLGASAVASLILQRVFLSNRFSSN